MTRFELLEQVHRMIPAEQIKLRLFDQMRRVATRFNALGVTRLYPPILTLDDVPR
ncbi:hypothetical protein BH11MYX1_BH11MYX1_18880 [soil metagenome]